MSVPHVALCVEVRVFGEGVHRRGWQCRLPDPHPQSGHDFGVDAEVYGRELDRQRPEWLAAELRKAAARARYQQRRIDELTAVASQLAAAWAGSGPIYGWELPDAAADWMRANAPAAADRLGLG